MSDIVRIWRGSTATTDADRYLEYLGETGLREYRATEGNLGALALRRSTGEGLTEFLTVSLWRDMAAIEAFAGPDTEKAVFYPEDERYLAEADSFVRHYELVGGSWPERGPSAAAPQG